MSRDLKKVRGKALKIPRITVLLTGRWKSKCKALREEHTALLWETARKPAWLEGRDSGEGHMR